MANDEAMEESAEPVARANALRAWLILNVRRKMNARLDQSKVPVAVRSLIPLAEQFGISDDLDRELLIRGTSEEERRALKAAVAEHDNDLDDWLAGAESTGPAYSKEYIAFSAMRMAADFV